MCLKIYDYGELESCKLDRAFAAVCKSDGSIRFFEPAEEQEYVEVEIFDEYTP